MCLKTAFADVLGKGDRRMTVFTNRILQTILLEVKQLQTYFPDPNHEFHGVFELFYHQY